MLITQEIDNLLNGVSQAPPQQRDASQSEDIVNALLHPSRGLRKRPPTQHVAKLTSLPIGWDSAFIYPILRDATHRYSMVVVNGDLQVYDAQTGTAQTVYFPDGKAYLTTTDIFRAATTGDTTIITNRSVVPRKNTAKKSAATVYEALISVRQSDYGTNFTVTLDGITVSYATPQATTTDARAQIGSDIVASQLVSLLRGNATLNANYTFTLYGSTIYLARKDAQDFTLTVTDGLSDGALLAIKGTVQTFEKLPTTVKNGMIVEVVGDPESSADNYYVQFTDSSSPSLGLPTHLTAPSRGGVWREVIGPGLLTSFDPSTLPHQLAFCGDILSSQVNAKLAVLPLASGAGASGSTAQGWTKENGTAVPDTADITATAHSDTFEAVISGADGSLKQFTLNYDMDTTAVLAGDFLVVIAGQIETGSGTGVFTTIATQSFGYGAVNTNTELNFSASPVAGARVRAVMTYGSGVTPASPNRASWRVHGKNNTHGAGILVQSGYGATATFDPTTLYPSGLQFTVTVDGHPFSYTVGPSDQVGADVATAFAGLINPDATYNATATNGVLLVTQGSGVPPVLLVTNTWDPSKTFWCPTLALIAGSLIGLTIKNLTDGSSGTITANTVTTVSVSALSGGAANVFSAGDKCSIVGSGTYFVFKEAPWEDRAAGDDTTCPFPSFVDKAVDEVFIYQNRLGLTSGENIVMSRAGNFYNFFQETATDILDNDPIDVHSATKTIPRFFGVVPWLDGAYALTDQNLMRLSGEPVLTPKTVRLDPMGDYPSATDVRPIVADRHLFVVGQKNGFARAAIASRLPLTIATEGAVEMSDITRHVPTYLLGNPVQVCTDTQAGMLFVLTDGGSRRSVYVCTYDLGGAGEQTRQIAWCRWDFSPGAKVLSMDVVNGVVGFVIQQPDGIYLEEVTLDPPDVVPVDVLTGDGLGFGDGSYDGEGLKV